MYHYYWFISVASLKGKTVPLYDHEYIYVTLTMCQPPNLILTFDCMIVCSRQILNKEDIIFHALGLQTVM